MNALLCLNSKLGIIKDLQVTLYFNKYFAPVH